MFHAEAKHHFVENFTTAHTDHPLEMSTWNRCVSHSKAKHTSHRGRGAGGSVEARSHCDGALG